MSTTELIAAIITARNTIRNKLKTFGLATDNSTLSVLASAINGITGKAGETITPGTGNKEIAAGTYLTGKQIIAGDANLNPDNIRSGTSIFGVSGSYTGDTIGTDTSDATATGNDMLYGATAYAKGEMITGTIPSKSADTYYPSATDQTISADQYLSGAQTIKAVKITNLKAENIAKGVVVEVGDSEDSDRVAKIAGTLETGVDTSDITMGSDDLEVSGATVTVPAGYYPNGASASVTAGTEGTPTATKGTVTNNSVSITPKVTNSTGYITGGEKDGTAVTVTAGELVSGTKPITDSGETDVTNYAKVSVAAGSATAPASISESSATVTTGTNTLTLTKTVSVTPSVTAGYVSSGTAANSAVSLTASVAINDSDNLTASGATVSVPAGYYPDGASKAVASGSVGTPTATKGAVSNNSISVTPKVTNSTGYITGGEKTGTAVTISASELVSGNKPITGSGSTDVTNYATVSVAAGSAATPADSITSNPTITVSDSGLIKASHSGSKSITPTVSAGYVSSGTAGTVSTSGNATKQLTTKAGETITPGTNNREIAAGTYLTGKQIILGDTNLKPEYIKKGITIFGVTGTYDPLDLENGILIEDKNGNTWCIPKGNCTSGDIEVEDASGTTYYIPQDSTNGS